jgi:ABC-2 type transport system ATP-binding protein
MMRAQALSKRYGSTWAVRDLSFDVEPGQVTGFLGPNGAGKSTTLRLFVGLERPTAGQALIEGRPYAELRRPLRHVGALLDPGALHGDRSAAMHLTWLARSNDLPARRVEEVLAMTGLSDVAGRRTRTFSLGMRQRLGIAAALLGDPATVLLDEPVNGLDPEGIVWMRQLLRSLAADGRTVLVSSHLMSEVAASADRLVVLGTGRLLADGPLTDFTSGGRSLEDSYLSLTGAAVEYRSQP